MAKESLFADGEEVQALCAAAKQKNVYVSVGMSEKVRYSSATLFNSNLIIGPGGELLVHHRKLMPTYFEKLTWSHGDGHGLRVADTPFGKIGALICGENTNPLARYALMSQGEQLHISTWPAVWPTRVEKPSRGQIQEITPSSEPQPSRSSVAGPNYDNVAANKIRAAAHCFEAKCFGVLSASHLDDLTIDAIATASSDPQFLSAVLKRCPRGATMFLDPTGALVKGLTIDPGSGAAKETAFLQADEDILYADLNLTDCVEGKQYHDVVGSYQRLDVFDFKVDRTRKQPATFSREIDP